MSVNKKNNSQNEKKLLDVYYYIDFDDKLVDISLLEQCIQINVHVNAKEYIVNRFINCNNEYINTSKINDEDIVKRGLLIFNKMFRRLKLKNTTETWFIYMSNGNINKNHKNVFVTLLNRYPCIKTCNYAINKHLQEKDVNDTLKQLFFTNQTIVYTNLMET